MNHTAVGGPSTPLTNLPESQPAQVIDYNTEDGSVPCRVSMRYPPAIQQWCSLITQYAEKNGLSPNLIAAVMLQESGGDPLSYSHSGAVGLMQVMPRDGIAASFLCKNRPCFASRPTISELQDPAFNLEYATGMMAGLLSRFGNLRDSLRAYGPMDMGYIYADKVLAIYQNYGN
jgi:soluble lytic murein transglycosylase-like protein